MGDQVGRNTQYAAAAARALAPGGVMALVHTWAAHARVERAADEAGLEVVRAVPVALREGKPPHLGLYEVARRGARGKQGVQGAFVVRDGHGARSPEFRAARAWMGFPP
jgi:tRNA1(Val) A37 N6-methylase TrmN6